MGVALLVPNVDWSGNNLGQVTVSGVVEIQSLSIVGQNAIASQTQYKVDFQPAFTTQRGITWSITSGGSYASIDQYGVVTPLTGAYLNEVTIRATSTSNTSIYAEKTILVTEGAIVFYDYIESDGNAFIVHPGLESFWGATVTVRGTLNNNNGYLFGSRRSTTGSNAARMAAYQNNEGRVSALVGSRGFQSLGFVKTDSSTVYKWVFTSATASGQTDGDCVCYEDATSTQKGEITGSQMGMSGHISIFTLGSGAYGGTFKDNASNHGACKFCGLTVESDGDTLIDLRPCTVGGTPAIQDVVSGLIYYNSGASGLTAGNF